MARSKGRTALNVASIILKTLKFDFADAADMTIELINGEDGTSAVKRKDLLLGSIEHHEATRDTPRFRNLAIDPDIVCSVTATRAETTEFDDLYSYLLEPVSEASRMHFFLTGDGGMGKTVSMLLLWQRLLEEVGETGVLPFYVQLSEINAPGESGEYGFIARQIARNCLPRGENPSAEDIFETLNVPTPEDLCGAVIILDGYNEVAIDSRAALSREIQDIASRYGNVRMVITSRFEPGSGSEWLNDDEFEALELVPLHEETVRSYLEERGIDYPDDENTRALIANPMMLMLYTETVIAHAEGAEAIESCGHLIDVFVNQLVTKPQNAQVAETQDIKFLANYLLPYIAYKMGSQELFSLGYKKLVQYTIEACNTEYAQDKYGEVLAGGRQGFGFNYQQVLGLGAYDQERASRILEIAVASIGLLVGNSAGARSSYEFIHQHYRDFFAAKFIIAEMTASADEPNDVATSIEGRLLPEHIARMIGEIGKEHRFKEAILESRYHYKGDESPLTCYLEKIRDDLSGDAHAIALRNLIAIWVLARGELSGINLSELDLTGINFNNVICGRGRRRAADFHDATLEFAAFMPTGHFQWVYRTAYEADDPRRCVSASRDGYVKEWDLVTRTCLGEYLMPTEALYAFRLNENELVAVLTGGSIVRISQESGEIAETLELGCEIAGSEFDDARRRLCVLCADGRLGFVTFKGAMAFATTCELDGTCTAFDLSMDRRTCAIGMQNGEIALVNMTGGKVVDRTKVFDEPVRAVAASRVAGIVAATASGGLVQEWDLRSDKVIREFAGHTASVNCIFYNDDFTKLLTASADNSVREWSVATGECVQLFRQHYDAVFYACYNEDCSKVLSSSRDFSIREWDTKNGECTLAFEGLSYFTRSTRFSEDGTLVLAASCDGTVREWDAYTGDCVTTYLGHTARVYSADYSSDGSRMLSASLDRTVLEWGQGAGDAFELVARHGQCVDRAAYLDDDHVVSVSSDGHIVLSERTEDGWLDTERVFDYTPAPHGDVTKTVGTNAVWAVDGEDWFIASYWDCAILKWDSATGELLQRYNGHENWVYSCALTDDHATMYSSGKDGRVIRWDVASGEKLAEVQLDFGSLYTIDLDEERCEMIVATSKGPVLVLDMDSMAEVGRLEGHTTRAFSAAYSADCSSVVSFSEDRTVRTWDAASRENTATFDNVMGVIVDGCNFTGVENNSSDYERRVIAQYGGLL